MLDAQSELYQLLDHHTLRKVLAALKESETYGYNCGVDDGFKLGIERQEREIARLKAQILILETKLEVKTDILA